MSKKQESPKNVFVFTKLQVLLQKFSKFFQLTRISKIKITWRIFSDLKLLCSLSFIGDDMLILV